MKAMLSVPEKRVSGSCSVCHWPEALSDSVSCGVKVLGSVGTGICPTTRRARLWLSVRRRRVSWCVSMSPTASCGSAAIEGLPADAFMCSVWLPPSAAISGVPLLERPTAHPKGMPAGSAASIFSQ